MSLGHGWWRQARLTTFIVFMDYIFIITYVNDFLQFHYYLDVIHHFVYEGTIVMALYDFLVVDGTNALTLLFPW